MDNKKIASELIKMAKEISGAYSEEYEKKYEKNYLSFIKELEKLSKKYGVAIKSIGGVEVGDIKSISYSDDMSSGDLLYKAQWID